jgi:raffinose/stachyose/melibiose transport system permease protein
VSREYTPRLVLLEILVVIGALVFMVPFAFVLLNSFKPIAEIVKNASAWPQTFTWQNYTKTIEQIKFLRVLTNSLIISGGSIAGMVILGAMAAWKMARTGNRIARIMFFLYVVAMVIPFQSLMIPLVKVAMVLKMLNTRWGLIIIYFGFGMPFTVFLYHGFVKSVPRDMEESGAIDGCNDLRLFWQIVLPLLKTITTTVIILQTLWIWNDFLLPFLILYKQKLHTIPLAVNRFFGQYLNQWDKALAALVLSIIPIVVFFLFLQKNIIRGISAGALKG